MVLDKEVEIRISPGNCKYYQSLGYEIPMRNGYYNKPVIDFSASITVRVDDLSGGSNVCVKCKCDGCGKIYDVYWFSITRGVGGKLCHTCALKSVSSDYKNARGESIYLKYRHGATRRKIRWALSRKQFHLMVPGICHYCHRPSEGVDRKDPSIEYVTQNCVPSCSDCNVGKWSLGELDFIKHCIRISNHQPEWIYHANTESKAWTYNKYRRNAKNRKLKFDLSFDEFSHIRSHGCYYCGDFYIDRHIGGKRLYGIGIDRIDNSIGYTVDNCVPCCKNCNRMKRQMPVDEFRNLARLVSINWMHRIPIYSEFSYNDRLILNERMI